MSNRSIARSAVALAILLLALTPAPAAEPLSEADFEVLDITRIWDEAPHNAFPDLARFDGHWYVSLREGQNHVSEDGRVRVIRSADGQEWETVALFESDDEDLREFRFARTPDDRLMVIGAGCEIVDGQRGPHQSYVYVTDDGEHWQGPHEVGDHDFWMWSATWHDGTGYSVGYRTAAADEHFVRLYTSDDALNWQTHIETLFDVGYPNETALLFQEDTGGAVLLLRRDHEHPAAVLGTADPPYTDWTFRELNHAIGGPSTTALPDGRIVGGMRLHNPTRTALVELDVDQAELREILSFPSAGDTGYTGTVFHDDQVWVAYYSMHEDDRSSIYLARVRVLK